MKDKAANAHTLTSETYSLKDHFKKITKNKIE